MLSKFSVKKPYTVLVAVVLAIVLGVVSFTRMTTDLLPSISLPYVIVMTTYVGASPETVETVVTKPVEASMATVSNIESISSVSSENYSTVILEFAQSTDMNAASLEIRENLDQIKSYWDDSVGNPIIMKLNPDMLPVMIAAVGGAGMDAAQVTGMTQDTIMPELESIEGVASVSATGLMEESVSVVIRQEKIDKINEQVFGAIDEEIDEVKEELNENKQDIYEGQAELADARSEMEESRQKLADSQQELEDSRKEIEDGKQKIADGRAEISENKIKLEEGKTELANKKEEAARELAETETKLLTAKADAEAAKIHLTLELEQAKMMLEEAKKGLEDNGVMPPDGMISADEIQAGIDEGNALSSALDGYGADDLYDTISDSSLKSRIEAYLAPDFPYDEPDLTIGAVQGLIDNKKSSFEAMQEVYNGYQQQIAAQEFIKQTIATYEQTIVEMAGKISELEDTISQIDDGLNQLYKGNLQAASEFANAQTAISLGELQITTAESQLEASEKQLESGEKQLESGQEQIDSGWEQIADGEEQLKDTAEQLADALQQILDGEEELEENRINAYDKANMKGILTVETVEALLQAQNFSMPAGYVTEEGISYLIRVGDKPEEINELKKMPLMNLEMDGVDIITLGDVADVFMTDNSADIYANVNGAPGIMVTIQKQTGYSTGDVSDKILDKFKELMDENEDLMLITLMDQGIYIDLVMDSIMNNILFGAGLAILILILFLKDLRPTMVIACSIPISLITAIVCMYFSGVTLNVISLSGLALGIGMLVDNSIVVIENIYRLRREGYSAKEAATEGAGEVAGAIMASTLTTVCVFLPIVFTEGITRQLFVDMGLTIAYSLLASLVIALTVVPAMASKVLVKTRENTDGKFFTKLVDVYEKLLGLSLKAKPVVVLLVIVLLVASAMASYAKGTAFMPDMDSTQFTISLTMPEDALLSETAQVTDEIVEKLIAHEDVSDVGAMASTSSLSMLTGGGDVVANETVIYVTLNMDKKKTNEVIADEIMKETAEICEKNKAEMVIDTSSMDMSAMGGSGVSVQIRGRDIDKLQELARDVASIVSGVEGTANVSDGLEDSMEEMRVVIDRNKAIEHGMTVAEVFRQVAAKLAESASTTTLETEESEYGVYVKDAKDLELTRALIKDLEIERNTKDDTKERFPLSEVASFENTISPKAVNRIDQSRYISVSAEIADGYNVGLVSADVEEALEDYKLPAGYYLEMTGENETITDAMEQLYLMLILALIFMYLIMVAQFQSLLSPFIIMFTIPLAFTGGFLGLVISDSELSVIALIGFVMLSGIIVNNGIVLVDYINQLRGEGMEKREAILTAGRTRLRPVLMTALTTILALCTMVAGKDMGSEMGRPMAVVTIGGLVYGTVLTLVVIPCIYDIFSREKKKPGDFSAKKPLEIEEKKEGLFHINQLFHKKEIEAGKNGGL
ncbi:efflux RND transporter permease subunit [Parablautia muri]|uniref:Acriflavin resistance protein n=1 Tax=Parablautia muri TaxID=2320879 RepID=A0A9X5BDJ8_9FIRM|nr:efflux RND transporter permease subunit [Parablautia muri]NBJ91754.1 acriflavin resistance protein [Parablautia muri]